MASFPQLITVRYNGYRFPVETETEYLNITPVYDSAGRTVVYSELSLRVRCILQDSSGVDAEALSVRRRLQQPACKLEVTTLGTGAVSINVGGTKDVMWGPKPGAVTIKPLGGGNACELTWEVTARVPDCCDSPRTEVPGILEFNYALTFNIDEAGATSRTYFGHLVIPQTRKNSGDRTVRASADDYRTDVVPPAVPGFRRTSQSYSLSEDKCRLDFSVTDSQMLGPAPPPGVIDFSISHSRQSTNPTMGQWTETVAGRYTLAQNGRPQSATVHFLTLVGDRMKAVQRAATAAQATAGKGTKGCGVIVLEYSDGCDFGSGQSPVARFTVRYRVVSAAWTIIAASSIWRPVPGSNWQLWAASVPLGPRGHASLVFRPGDDRITDLCEPGNTSELRTNPTFPGAAPVFSYLSTGADPDASWLTYIVGTRTEPANNVAVLKSLPEKKSDVNTLKIDPDALPGKLTSGGGASAAATTKPTGGIAGGIAGAIGGSVGGAVGGLARAAAPNRLPSPGGPAGDGSRPSPAPGATDSSGFFIDGGGAAKPFVTPENDPFFTPLFAQPGGKPKPLPNATPKLNPPPNLAVEKADAAVQQRAFPTVYITLFGHALRVGYPISIPELVEIDGVPLRACNKQGQGYGFWQAIVGSAAGAPIYAARWCLLYVSEKVPPKGVPPVPNPLA